MSLISNTEYDPDIDRFFHSTELSAASSDCRLSSLCIHIGYQCNLKCSYCSSRNGKEINNSLELKQILDFLDFYQVPRIVLSGGEPFLYPQKLQQWLPEFKKRGITTFVATNGSFPDSLTALSPFIDWIDVSLPATNRELYQAIRGVDMFERVLSFIRYAQECGIRVRISYTVNSLNMNDVFLLPELVKTLGITNIRISHTYGTGELVWKNENGLRIKNLFRSICGEHIQIYTPLTPAKLSAYQKGYPILTPSGEIFLFDINPENFVCKIKDAYLQSNVDKFSQIAVSQQYLFHKE